MRRDPPIIKIADFGAAKFVDDSTALLVSLTHAYKKDRILIVAFLQSACGTVYFVAPEMIRSLREKGKCTTLVDSFSLGAVLYYWCVFFLSELLFPVLTPRLVSL